MMDAALRCEDIRAVGFFLFAASGIVVAFANSGAIIADSLVIIRGADILIARLLALNRESASHE